MGTATATRQPQQNGGNPLPKCFCNWKHCRTYQKAFREFNHPLYNGVIKLKFYENDPRSMALKASIDRTLNVEPVKRNDWREVTASTSPDNNTERYCRYYVARHHFMEALIRQYSNNRRTWDWSRPLSIDQAEIFLYSLDQEDMVVVDNTESGEAQELYVQAPNVPKDQVRELLKRLKEENRNNSSNSNSRGRSNGNGISNSIIHNDRQHRNTGGGTNIISSPTNASTTITDTTINTTSPIPQPQQEQQQQKTRSPFLSPKQPQRKRATEYLQLQQELPHQENNVTDTPTSIKSSSGNKKYRKSAQSKAATGNSNAFKQQQKQQHDDSDDYDDGDNNNEDDEDDDDGRCDDEEEEENICGDSSSSIVAATNNNPRREDDSLASSSAALVQKDEENTILRQELTTCKEQINMLQSIVEQLKLHVDLEGTAAATGSSNSNKSKNEMKKTTNTKIKKKKAMKNNKRKDSSFSSHEEEYNDENDEVESSSSDEEDEEVEVEDSSSEEEVEEETFSTNYNHTSSGGGTTTFTSNSRQNSQSGQHQTRPSNNRQSIRRGSIHSRRSIHGGSIVSRSSRRQSRRGSMRGGDDGASVMSRQSLQSISVSMKSLPREIELMDDDDEGDIRGNKDDSSYFDDTRSIGSRSAASRVSRRSFVSGNRIRSRRSTRGGGGGGGSANRRTRSGNASTGNSSSRGSRGGSGSVRGAVPQEIDLSGDELENIDVTHANVSTDTLFVKEKQIVDPYGEKGVYTGALSKSTCMPNGKGRLEYEKECRWYEGDWIHGRWTGYGRLSNGDGDFYEGGLKNDHKHGTGIMKFADGRIFEGEYIRGQMIQGKMTYQDGSVYGGSWVDGMRHGRGRCVFIDGSEYEGEFREGNFHGHGKMTWNDGGWYVGDWCDGEMHGRGKEVRPDGAIRHDGEWARGQPIRSATETRRRRQLQQQQQQQQQQLSGEESD